MHIFHGLFPHQTSFHMQHLAFDEVLLLSNFTDELTKAKEG